MTTTTRASCWKVTLTDATVFGFTDHDKDLTVSGVVYKSAIGYVPAAFERSIDLQADTTEVTGIIDSVDITAADLRSGKWDGARVEIIEVDWATGTKLRTLKIGFLGETKLATKQYNTVLNGLESELAKPVGRTVTIRCDAELGDTRCGYSLSADSVTLTGVTDTITFADSSLGGADDDYNNGKITWLTGDNAGLTFDVKKYTASTGEIILYEPMPSSATIGDTANIYIGCDRTFETCRDTFSNQVNFRGFPHLPGVSDIIAGTIVT